MQTSKTERLLLQEIADKVNEMHLNFNGNPKAGVEGLYDKIKRHDGSIEQYKNDRLKAITVLTVLVAAWESFRSYFIK